MTDSVCPQCGGQIVPSKSGGSFVLTCTKCPWSVATTDYDRPGFDTSNYQVYIATTGEGPSAKAAAQLAVQLGINAREALEVLKEKRPLSETFSAVEVIRAMESLTPLGFLVSTVPSFPWSVEDEA